ncbi:MAG: transporter [Anaerolineae bacterium]|nr:MAG: transporter [Anaerolineae bacterium]
MIEWKEMVWRPETETIPQPTPDLSWWTDAGLDHEAIVARFEPIGLDEMLAVALMDRYETKFVFHERRLGDILSALAGVYRVLEVNGTRFNRYSTLYIDSPGFDLYRRHQAGGRNGYKARGRYYLDAGISFLEVKHKVKANRTVKSRIEIADVGSQLGSQLGGDLSPDLLGFLAGHLPGDAAALEPKLWNDYTRITLVHLESAERVTIDLNLKFRSGEETVIVPDIVVAEVKRGRDQSNSPFMAVMKAGQIRSTSFSKYCIGVSMLYPEIKHNRFKSRLSMMSKIIHGEDYHVN